MSCEVDGYNAVESYTERRARKVHECSCCDEPIRVGDVYVTIFVVYDGDPRTYKHCLRCHAVFQAAAKRHQDLHTGESVRFDLGCGHDWRETFDEDPPETVAKLAFMTADELQAELRQTTESP